MCSLLVLRLVLVGAAFRSSEAFAAEMYTQNPLCRQNACINPMFPGLNDLARLEKLTWQCTADSLARSATDHMTFCKDAVRYNVALPSPNASAQPLDRLIKAQDDAAATMFFYHLSGLGYEAWDHQEPTKSSDACVRATWKMVCYTYFPKADAGCKKGELSLYQRPCMNSCSDYMKSCAVECCDESPKCVFEHSVDVGSDGTSVVQTGYVNAVGPSAICTGGFGDHSGSRGFSARFALMLALLAVTLSLQGCEDIPKHMLGNWRGKADYLVSYEYVPIGGNVNQASLNSCSSDMDLSATLQCSGRGYCKAWNIFKSDSISFCSCDADYADPECRTKRRSQTTTFLCALFGGFFGLDYFYLGMPLWGLAKLFSLGGFGFWWLVDIIRTGSGAVYAHDFRVAQDLPHWAYVLSVTGLFMVAGLVISMESYFRFRNAKRRELLMMQQSAEKWDMSQDSAVDRGKTTFGPQYLQASQGESFAQPREFMGYGSTLPAPLPTAGAPVIPAVQMAPTGVHRHVTGI